MSTPTLSKEMEALLSRFVLSDASKESTLLMFDILALARSEGILEAAEFVKDTAEEVERRAEPLEESLRALLNLNAKSIRQVGAKLVILAQEHKGMAQAAKEEMAGEL